MSQSFMSFEKIPRTSCKLVPVLYQEYEHGLFYGLPTETLEWSRDGAVMKAHAFHQSGPGSNPGPSS